MGIGIDRNHPNKKNQKKISLFCFYVSLEKKIKRTQEDKFSKKESERLLCYETVILDFSLVPFMTWGKELIGEATIFFFFFQILDI